MTKGLSHVSVAAIKREWPAPNTYNSPNNNDQQAQGKVSIMAAQEQLRKNMSSYLATSDLIIACFPWWVSKVFLWSKCCWLMVSRGCDLIVWPPGNSADQRQKGPPSHSGIKCHFSEPVTGGQNQIHRWFVCDGTFLHWLWLVGFSLKPIITTNTYRHG